MRRIFIAVATLFLVASATARARDVVKADQDYGGFHAYHLGSPFSAVDPSTSPLRLQDVAIGNCIPYPSAVNGTFSCLIIDGPLGVSAGHLQLSFDSTLRNNSGSLGLNTIPGLSILGTSANMTGPPGAIPASTALTVPLVNAAGTAIAWSSVPAAATTGIVANWPLTTVRTFLYDPVNGNDANPGYSDVAGPYNPVTQAKATEAGLASVLPTTFA